MPLSMSIYSHSKRPGGRHCIFINNYRGNSMGNKWYRCSWGRVLPIKTVNLRKVHAEGNLQKRLVSVCEPKPSAGYPAIPHGYQRDAKITLQSTLTCILP